MDIGSTAALSLTVASSVNLIAAFFIFRKAKFNDAKFWFGVVLLSSVLMGFSLATVRSWGRETSPPTFLGELILTAGYICPTAFTCFAIDFITDKSWPKAVAWLITTPLLLLGAVTSGGLVLDPTLGWIYRMEDVPHGFIQVGLAYLVVSAIVQIGILAYVTKTIPRRLLRRKMFLFVLGIVVVWCGILSFALSPNGALIAVFWILATFLFWEAFRIKEKARQPSD